MLQIEQTELLCYNQKQTRIVHKLQIQGTLGASNHKILKRNPITKHQHRQISRQQFIAFSEENILWIYTQSPHDIFIHHFCLSRDFSNILARDHLAIKISFVLDPSTSIENRLGNYAVHNTVCICQRKGTPLQNNLDLLRT